VSLAPTLALTLSLTLAIYFGDGLMLVSTASSFDQAEGEHGVFSSDSSNNSFVDSSYLFRCLLHARVDGY